MYITVEKNENYEIYKDDCPVTFVGKERIEAECSYYVSIDNIQALRTSSLENARKFVLLKPKSNYNPSFGTFYTDSNKNKIDMNLF